MLYFEVEKKDECLSTCVTVTCHCRIFMDIWVALTGKILSVWLDGRCKGNVSNSYLFYSTRGLKIKLKIFIGIHVTGHKLVMSDLCHMQRKISELGHSNPKVYTWECIQSLTCFYKSSKKRKKEREKERKKEAKTIIIVLLIWDTWERDVPYYSICTVPHFSPSGNRSYRHNISFQCKIAELNVEHWSKGWICYGALQGTHSPCIDHRQCLLFIVRLCLSVFLSETGSEWKLQFVYL